MIVALKGHYLVRVKRNAKLLFEALEQQTCFDSPSALIQSNHKRHTLIRREVHCFAYHDQVPAWKKIKVATLIRVERTFMRKEGPHLERAYYVTSHQWNEKQAAFFIRKHWEIENKLHWDKDVLFKEDTRTPNKGNVPQNLAMVYNIVVSLYRKNGFNSITKAIRACAHDINRLFYMLKNVYQIGIPQ